MGSGPEVDTVTILCEVACHRCFKKQPRNREELLRYERCLDSCVNQCRERLGTVCEEGA